VKNAPLFFYRSITLQLVDGKSSSYAGSGLWLYGHRYLITTTLVVLLSEVFDNRALTIHTLASSKRIVAADVKVW